MKERILVVVGENLRRIRKEKKLTIERLAMMSGVHKSYISDLERGERNPTVVLLDRLAYALQIDPRELLDKGKSPTELAKDPFIDLRIY